MLKIEPYSSTTNNISLFSLNQTYINGRQCPHCGSQHVHSNGNYKGRKRYLCNKCGKSYNDLTKTPFSGIHDLNKVMMYLNCMISGDSIRKAAKSVNISVATSFSWRHKLLSKIRQLPPPKMKNVKELVELEIPYSHKGQKKKISKTQLKTKISVLFICDRTGKLDSDSIALHRRNKNPLLSRINKFSTNNSEIISTTKFHNIILSPQTNVKSSNSSYYQTSLINQIIPIWKTWMVRFHGVASKYLSNYLHWFDFLDNSQSKQHQTEYFIQLLLKHSY